MRVVINYKNGVSETREMSDCPTIEHIANSVFGMTYAEAQDHGVIITETDENGNMLGETIDAGPEVVEEVTHEEEDHPTKKARKHK